MNAPTDRLLPGDVIAPFHLDTLAHGRLGVPAAGLLHLQFRRFAGCPVCNLHLREFAERWDEISAAGVMSVAFFHSRSEQLLPHQESLPMAIVADPERRFYKEFRVERSLSAIASPRVWARAVRSVVQGATNPLEGGAQDGLPADFLLGPDGVLRAVHYGRHADDQWSVDTLVQLAARARASSSTSSTIGLART